MRDLLTDSVMAFDCFSLQNFADCLLVLSVQLLMLNECSTLFASGLTVSMFPADALTRSMRLQNPLYSGGAEIGARFEASPHSFAADAVASRKASKQLS